MGNDPQRYAENLANQAFEALTKEGAKAPFIFRCQDDTPCVVIPIISHDMETVQLWVFYSPTARLSAVKLMDADPKELTFLWRRYCRAFVHARMSPRSDRYVLLVDHAATRRAAATLSKPYNCALAPYESDIDKALGTKLKKAHNERWTVIDRWGRPVVQPTA